jgi:hypothetical protein
VRARVLVDRSFVFRVSFAIALSLGALLVSPRARAEAPVPLDGRWLASPLTVKWIVGDWGAACGPRPSGGGEAGASVVISTSGGELVISGGGRTYSTSQCWEQYPGMSRVNHSAAPRAWKSVCRTAAGDPRQAALNTTITATDDRLSFYEAGQYQFVIEGQNCTASVGRYRTYTLVQRADAPEVPAEVPSAQRTTTEAKPPPPKKPEPAQPASSRCASPGPAARLEVRPARKLVRAGETFEFRAIVSDAAGCPVYTRPAWALESGSEHAELTAPATIHVKPDAPEGEVKLTASLGGRSALVTVEIASSERYDGLLRSGAFNAAGEVDEAATVAIASQAIGAESAVAEDRAGGRKWLFVGLVAVVAMALGVVGVVLMSRSRKAAELQAAREAAKQERKKRVGEPVQAAVAPPRQPPAAAAPAPAATGPKTICPVCGEQYAAESRFCGKDGATLMPLN